RQHSETEFAIAPSAADDVRRLLASLAANGKLAGVIHCWSLDHPTSEELTADQLQAAQQTGALSALRLIQALGEAMPRRIWFVTPDVHRVREGDRSTGLASSPLIGLARVASNEHFPCVFTLIDLPANFGLEGHFKGLDDLVQEIIDDDGEYEVAYRG